MIVHRLNLQTTDHGDNILLTDAIFILPGHRQLLPGKQALYPGHRIRRDAAVILQPQPAVQIRKVLDLSAVVIDGQYPDAIDQRSIEPGADLIIGNLFAVQIEIQQLAAAFDAHGKGQCNGHRGSGIEAPGVGQGQSRPLEGALEYPHQIQMGYPDGISRLLKQQSRHRTPPP